MIGVAAGLLESPVATLTSKQIQGYNPESLFVRFRL